jgi:hypothetical protein
MLQVDASGSVRTLFVPKPSSAISGAEAFRQTLNGWQVHGMGVLKRSIYHEAESAFAFEGFNGDELLTRHILLHCRTVAGSEGTYFYRRINRSISKEETLDRLRSDVGLMRLIMHKCPDQASFVQERTRNIARTLFKLRLRGAPLRSINFLISELAPFHCSLDGISKALVRLSSIGTK